MGIFIHLSDTFDTFDTLVPNPPCSPHFFWGKVGTTIASIHAHDIMEEQEKIEIKEIRECIESLMIRIERIEKLLCHILAKKGVIK